mmetsp:Transcript_29885/g.48678  ORF Transcript_29885/g.48678 Transcript_29885/m.48678 type:complete len:201 (+) Transcript_29885:91-693(+)
MVNIIIYCGVLISFSSSITNSSLSICGGPSVCFSCALLCNRLCLSLPPSTTLTLTLARATSTLLLFNSHTAFTMSCRYSCDSMPISIKSDSCVIADIISILSKPLSMSSSTYFAGIECTLLRNQCLTSSARRRSTSGLSAIPFASYSPRVAIGCAVVDIEVIGLSCTFWSRGFAADTLSILGTETDSTRSFSRNDDTRCR